MQILIGGIIAVCLYIVINYSKKVDQLYIGQKVYYYIYDESKKYSGRIMSIITCYKEEDITNPSSSLRIIPSRDRKIKKSVSNFYEIQPIIGGEKILIPNTNILYKLKD